MVSDDVVSATHGGFVTTSAGDDKLCDIFAEEGIKNIEFHYDFPHLGKYCPDEDFWVPAVDDKWVVIKKTTDPDAPEEDAPYEQIMDYIGKVTHPVGTLDRTRRFIRQVQARGMKLFYYFQATEAWEFFANTCFPEAILRNDDGSPKLTWYDHVQMDCRPETRWGRYICQELERVLDLFPEIDGIFMDQSALDRNDYAVCRITDCLARIGARRGKMVYWNGPYLVELAEHAVGMLAESAASESAHIRFLTIGNKVCCGRGFSQRDFQRNLLNGLWPTSSHYLHYLDFLISDDLATVMPISDEEKSIQRRYMELFQWYVGKTWVLEPHALNVPRNVEGNIFQRPDGDYLVPVIVPQHRSQDGRCIRNVEIEVRASEVKRIQGVYLRTVDVPGLFALPWRLEDNCIRVTVPWVNSAAVIWLSKQKQPTNQNMPDFNQLPVAVHKPLSRVMDAILTMEGLIPQGAYNVGGTMHFDTVTTTAPLARVPLRKIKLNGLDAGYLASKNYRNWRSLGTRLAVNHDKLLNALKTENELVIEPDGPEDFLAVRNIRLVLILDDGRKIKSDLVKQAYSSCNHPGAEGIVAQPIKMSLQFPDVPKL